jgi:hypothetical protein
VWQMDVEMVHSHCPAHVCSQTLFPHVLDSGSDQKDLFVACSTRYKPVSIFVCHTVTASVDLISEMDCSIMKR